MSILSDIIQDVFGTGSQQTTATATPEAPPDVKAAREDLMARARAFAAEPYPTYNQPRVAGFTPDQQAGFEATRRLAEQSGAYGAMAPELVQEGVSAARNLATRLPETDLSGYMSPYTQGVLEPTIRAIEERAAQERLRLGQQAGMRGAFGGSRQAIAESELERGTQRNIAEETARQRAAAYNQALQQFRIDQERIPALYSAALGQVGTGIGQTAARLGTEVNPVLAIGGAQQGLNQRNLDVLRETFLEERDYPLRGIDVLRGALGLTPSTLGVGTATTSTTPGSNVLGTIISGISQAPNTIQNVTTGLQSIGRLFGL